MKSLSQFSLLNTVKALDRTSSDVVQPPKVMHMREDEYRNIHLYNWPMNPKSCPSPYNNIENGDGDKDLATMVHDFIENGSYGCEHNIDSSDLDNNSPNSEMLCNNLQVLSSAINPFEMDLKSEVDVVLSTHSVKDLACKVENTECKGGCVRRFVAHYLKSLRHNAAICNIKWQNSGKVPGGEYEYIDVIPDEGYANGHRIVIDLDFQSQFEIARPTQHYLAALKLLPVIFVGPWKRLEEILRIMSEAAKYSLKQNSMPVPPWRTLEYMCAKWLTPCDRKVCDISSSLSKVHSTQRTSLEQDFDLDSSKSNQCWELVERLKSSYQYKDEIDRKSFNLKNCSCRVGKPYLIRNRSNAW